MIEQQDDLQTEQFLAGDAELPEVGHDVCDFLHETANLFLKLLQREEFVKAPLEVVLHALHVAFVELSECRLDGVAASGTTG